MVTATSRRHRRALGPLVALALAGSLITDPGPVHAAPAPRLQQGDLLIANHGFEQGVDGWTRSDGRGEPPSPLCAAKLTVTDGWSSEGAWSLRLPGSPPCVNSGAVGSAVPAVAGETYTATAHVHGAAPSSIGLRWLDAGGAMVGSQHADRVKGNGVRKVSAVAPAGATQVAVEVGASGGALVDDVLITAPYTVLERQVTKPTTFLSMAAGVDENGRAVTYAMGTGSADDPAILTITDILTAEVVRTVRLPGAVGSWAIRQNPVTKTVYIGTYQSAALWLYTPGEDTARRVGPPPINGWGFNYEMDFDENGIAYGGGWGEPTGGYAGATLYRYSEAGGYQGTLGPSPLTTDAYYTRTVAYEEQTKTIFTGTGTKPHLFACSTVGEANCQDLIGLFSEELQRSVWVYGLTASKGYVMAWAGDSASLGRDSLVVLKVSRDTGGTLQASVVKEIKGVIFNGSSPVVDSKIYYSKANDPGQPLYSFDLTSQAEAKMPNSDTGIFSRRWEALQLDDPEWPGTTLVGWNSGSFLVKYNLQTQRLVRTKIEDVPDVAVGVNSLVGGPDGRVWSAGYLTGGLGGERPMRDDQHVSYALGGQAEGMLSYRGRVYQGTYPNGRIESFTAAELAAGQRPRVDCTIGADQNRPYGLAGHGDRVYYGSQAEYGHTYGAFGWLDLKTGTCTTLEQVIGHQSVNTVAASGSKVFGGGNIFYGFDGLPIEEQAKLLIFDETTQQAKTIEWPVPGTRSINAAVTGPGGIVWFYAEGWLLAMDPATERWVHREEIFPDWKPGARIPGNYAELLVHPDGKIYGNAAGRVFGFDPTEALASGSAADTVKILFQGAGAHLTKDTYDNLYVAYTSTDLLRIARP